MASRFVRQFTFASAFFALLFATASFAKNARKGKVAQLGEETPAPTETTTAIPTSTSTPACNVYGTWGLTQITCNGVDSTTVPQASLSSGSNYQTAYLGAGSGYRVWNYSGCFQSVPMTGITATSTTVTFTDGYIFCSAANCGSGCAGNGNTNTFSYTMSTDCNSLVLNVASYSPYFNPCAGQSAPIVATYTRLN